MVTISSVVTMVTPPVALGYAVLAIRQVRGRRLAILALALSGTETLLLALLFLTGQ